MLGDDLIKKGLITQAQLDAALAAQASNPGKKIGELLVMTGALSQADLDAALG
jgi:hypothetical protein